MKMATEIGKSFPKGNIISSIYFKYAILFFLIVLSVSINLSLSISQISLGCLILCFIIYLIDNKYNIWACDIYFLLFIFYWFSAILSTLFGSEYADIARGIVSPWPMLAFFVALYFVEKKYIPYIILFFAIGIFVNTLACYYYYFAFSDIDIRFSRSHSLVAGYMMTAHLFCIDIIFLSSIVLYKLEKNKYFVIFYIIVILSSLFALLLTSSRMPLLVSILIVSLMLIFRFKWFGLVYAILLFLAIIIYVSQNEYMLSRFDNFFANFSNPTTSNGWRMLLWQEGFQVFKEYPIFGIGVNAYKHFMAQVMPDYDLPLTHAHNSYLMHLYAFGICGIITFFLFYGKIAYDIIKSVKKSPYAICGLSIIVAYFLIALTEYNTGLFLSSTQVLFLLGVMMKAVREESVV